MFGNIEEHDILCGCHVCGKAHYVRAYFISSTIITIEHEGEKKQVPAHQCGAHTGLEVAAAYWGGLDKIPPEHRRKIEARAEKERLEKLYK